MIAGEPRESSGNGVTTGIPTGEAETTGMGGTPREDDVVKAENVMVGVIAENVENAVAVVPVEIAMAAVTAKNVEAPGAIGEARKGDPTKETTVVVPTVERKDGTTIHAVRNRGTDMSALLPARHVTPHAIPEIKTRRCAITRSTSPVNWPSYAWRLYPR